jgi:hypothetical protein
MQHLLGVSIARITELFLYSYHSTTCDVGGALVSREDHARIVVILTVFDLLRHPSAPHCLLTWKIRLNKPAAQIGVLLMKRRLKTTGGRVCLVADEHHL